MLHITLSRTSIINVNLAEMKDFAKNWLEKCLLSDLLHSLLLETKARKSSLCP